MRRIVYAGNDNVCEGVIASTIDRLTIDHA